MTEIDSQQSCQSSDHKPSVWTVGRLLQPSLANWYNLTIQINRLSFNEKH